MWEIRSIFIQCSQTVYFSDRFCGYVNRVVTLHSKYCVSASNYTFLLPELQVLSPDAKGESHPQRCTSIPVQVSISKALRKKKSIWLLVYNKSRHLPHTIHKNSKWNAEKLFQGKYFCFWKQKRRRGDQDMTRKLTKQGWHLPCEL